MLGILEVQPTHLKVVKFKKHRIRVKSELKASTSLLQKQDVHLEFSPLFSVHCVIVEGGSVLSFHPAESCEAQAASFI